MKIKKFFLHILFIIFLTIFTQIGGILWLLSLLIFRISGLRKRFVFPVIYLVCNLLLVPPIAKKFGREALPIFHDSLEPRNLAYPLLFRNYVKPELKEVLLSSSSELNNRGLKLIYLDANFPFINGFPLLPHLSHNDGKKIDLSFIYLDKNGERTNKKPSLSGYGVYVKENNPTVNNCLNNGNWQYDFPKYLTLGKIHELKIDKTSTKKLIQTLISDSKSEKLFLEPYLKQKLGLGNRSKIRFHGCHSVRHDDHLHFQIK